MFPSISHLEHRLYWTDGYYDSIQSVDLDNLSDRITHISFSDIIVFGISAYYDHIYFTEFLNGGFYELDIATDEYRNISLHELPVDVKVYAG